MAKVRDREKREQGNKGVIGDNQMKEHRRQTYVKIVTSTKRNLTIKGARRCS